MDQLLARVYSFYPKDFFRKENNEAFIKFLMSQEFNKHEWHRGDPNKGEPDYWYGNCSVEFTIASDKTRKKQYNIIQKYKNGTYETNDLENEAFGIIEHALMEKSKKKYSTQNNYLCILCILDMTIWLMDIYGSYTFEVLDLLRGDFFEKIREQYIEKGNFKNIFLIMPDSNCNWWIWDLKTNIKTPIPLSYEMIISFRYPFVCTKEIYKAILSENTLEELEKILIFEEIP